MANNCVNIGKFGSKLTFFVFFVTDTSYSYHPAIHDDTFVRRKQRRNRTTFTLQQVCLLHFCSSYFVLISSRKKLKVGVTLVIHDVSVKNGFLSHAYESLHCF